MLVRPWFVLSFLLLGCGAATDPQQPVVSPYEDGGEGSEAGMVVECVAGELACKDVCTNLQSDGQHCGTCGNACGSSEHCSDGQCVAGGPGGRDGGPMRDGG